jgi:hypothetical protein
LSGYKLVELVLAGGRKFSVCAPGKVSSLSLSLSLSLFLSLSMSLSLFPYLSLSLSLFLSRPLPPPTPPPSSLSPPPLIYKFNNLPPSGCQQLTNSVNTNSVNLAHF